MSDPYVYDSINAFIKSNTGKGRLAVRGDTTYINRIKTLVTRAIIKLWVLYRYDEVGFQKMVALGSARDKALPLWLPGYQILVNKSERTVAKLGAASSTLVHEAVHLVADRPYVEEETLCRTVECLYYQDLLAGVTIQSSQTGKPLRVQIPRGNNMGDLMRMRAYYNKSQLVDYVLSMEEYRKALTSKWIKHSHTWWQGLKNRLPKTKGCYLKTLAADGPMGEWGLIIELLETISRKEWPEVKAAMIGVGGSLDKLRGALRYALESQHNWNKVAAVERVIGEQFATRRAA